MKFSPKRRIFAWLPQLHPQVWLLVLGRLLSETGSGFTLFYAPIFFVNSVGLSATSVGIALGSASISGVLGRILGGSFSDSKFWGRRRTLLLSAAVSALASLVLATTTNFLTLVVGNLLLGLGQGLYWPATEAVVADLTLELHRREAYAVTRLADNVGLGTGIVLGGVLISTARAYRALFVIDAISFVVFFGVVYVAITQTAPPAKRCGVSLLNSWVTALKNRRLLVYVVVNTIFTIYVSQLQSTMPLYFANFVPIGNSKGFTTTTITALFACQLALSIVFQLPVARALKRFSHPQALTFSALVWAVGFGLIWLTGVAAFGQLTWAILAQAMFALAFVAYTPSASALITDLAPPSQLGVYFSINSLCWAVGYFIGPPLGGLALDQPRAVVHHFWLGLALSVVLVILILQYLERILRRH